MIRADNLQHITWKKLNKSDDKIIAEFETYVPQVTDTESGIPELKLRSQTTPIISISQKKC